MERPKNKNEKKKDEKDQNPCEMVLFLFFF